MTDRKPPALFRTTVEIALVQLLATLKEAQDYLDKGEDLAAIGTLVYSWPDAYEKARAADRIVRARLEALGLVFEKIHTEFVGVDATHGKLAGRPDPDLAEVQLRVGVRARERAPVERFTREIAPLVLTGPPGVTGYGYKPDVKEIIAYWPALIDRTEVDPQVRTEVVTS